MNRSTDLSSIAYHGVTNINIGLVREKWEPETVTSTFGSGGGDFKYNTKLYSTDKKQVMEGVHGNLRIDYIGEG